jgi:hypothetical protein
VGIVGLLVDGPGRIGSGDSCFLQLVTRKIINRPAIIAGRLLFLFIVKIFNENLLITYTHKNTLWLGNQ